VVPVSRRSVQTARGDDGAAMTPAELMELIARDRKRDRQVVAAVEKAIREDDPPAFGECSTPFAHGRSRRALPRARLRGDPAQYLQSRRSMRSSRR
jgi:hypothetical protein